MRWVMSLPAGTVTFPVHRHRGLDAAAGRARPGGVCRGVVDAPARASCGVRGARRRRGGHAGRLVLRRVPARRCAVAAAWRARPLSAAGPIAVRMGLHTGAPIIAAEGYVGMDVHRAARIAAAAHGGQVLLSDATRQLRRTASSCAISVCTGSRIWMRPLRLFQLGDREFPPLKSLYRANLPVQATPLIGRDDALDGLCELIERRDVRLVTLDGTGRHRQDQARARRRRARRSGLPGRRPLDRTPGAARRRARPADDRSGSRDQDVAAAVGNGAVLLVLDNFEQVVDAATVVSDLLTACPTWRSSSPAASPSTCARSTSGRSRRSPRTPRWSSSPSAPRPPARTHPGTRGRRDLPAARRASTRDRVGGGTRALRRHQGRCWSGSNAGSTCSPPVLAIFPSGTARFARRSTGPASCSRRRSKGCLLFSPCSRAAAHRWWPRRSATPTSTRSNLSSRRVCCGSPTGVLDARDDQGVRARAAAGVGREPKQCGDVTRTLFVALAAAGGGGLARPGPAGVGRSSRR